MKSIIHFFINSNIWVAFSVVGFALSSEKLLAATNFKLSIFVFFATILTYNFHRIIRLGKGVNMIIKIGRKKIKKPFLS